MIVLDNTDSGDYLGIDHIGDCLQELIGCVSNEIGPDIFVLKQNQFKLIDFVNGQAKLIDAQQKKITELINLIRDDSEKPLVI
ncbi:MULTISPECIES: hypothetical protein [unclassified Microcoleus]|uniref:hypothetical protein n=1 Tax=unclassified Microcoleus TaxID=2642155 RepID=UPI001D6013C2|nr:MULTISPECIES: hypothetical protein [unclassified Microcoleus]MCC3473983.1 hypothetical protein [Microcoleus sp. PH2017_13_LAR_U_A]MCC3486065.1 hypothetical protein [Microcoleus sp. PH2017_14_LAR_D_A]MCC3598597.1 hypothetical protein [Microcoleus sp. PH2017_26_ELK_O_A]MCC3623921.1 hypothetical protein [Microcoleus sp. PH2017_36_ELK_O_B]